MANKRFGQEDPRLADHTHAVFGPRDEVLEDVLARCHDAGLPDIAVSALDGRLLEVLAGATGARKAVEIGTLGGYSGICLLRGMGNGGQLFTFELEPEHAEIARQSFDRHGFSPQVKLLVGEALGRLGDIEGDAPFDLVFIDADKGGYPAYLAWAERHLRPGGVALLDNAFLFGQVTGDPESDPEIAAMQKAWAMLADRSRFTSTVIPTGEGLAIGVKR